MNNSTLVQSINFIDSISSRLFSKFAVFLIILLMGFIIGKIAGKFLHKLLSELEVNKTIKKATKVRFALEEIISSIAKYFIYFIAIVWALNELGLTTTVLTLISAAALILIIVSLLLAVKDFIPNAIAGFFIYQKGLIKENDQITVQKTKGKVKQITLLETAIETKEKDIIHIPNSIITKTALRVKKRD